MFPAEVRAFTANGIAAHSYDGLFHSTQCTFHREGFFKWYVIYQAKYQIIRSDNTARKENEESPPI